MRWGIPGCWAAVVVAGVVCGHAALAADDDAKAFLDAVYHSYARDNQCAGPDYMHDRTKALGLFTPDTVGLLERAWAEEGPGFDILINAQDCQILTPPRVTITPAGTDRAQGTVAFTSFGEATVMTHDLVRSAAGWRIHDIHWGGDLSGTSLREVLKEF